MSKHRKVLLIGDSICMGYFPHVRKALAGMFQVSRIEGNAGDSGNLLTSLDSYLAAHADADLVHFNCGLHDIKRPRDGTGPQVPLPMYRRNLREIVERLKETGKRIVWGSTTPVICERHAAVKSFDRLESDVVAYNAAAAEIVAAHGIAINDLYGVVMAGGVDEYLSRDGVHMTDKGYAMLGEAVAAAVRKNFEGCSCSDAQPFY